MLSDEVIEKVSERLINRIEKVNTDILKTIGGNLDEIGKLSSTEAQKLIQVLKYGGDYNKIIKQLAKVSKLNSKEIKEIFEEVAKNDYRFAEQFYNYRNIAYIPYNENNALQQQVNAIANITARRCEQMMNPKVLGFGLIDDKGNKTFKGLKDAYYDLLDEAVISVSQGKETFDSAISKRIKQMGGGGLKVIYDSTYIDKDGVEKNRTRRLDSAIRMNLKDSLRELHNETQAIFGEQYNSDGVEISVHSNPAPDHQEVQGKQFSNEEFRKLQDSGIATSYDNKIIDLHRELKSGDKTVDYRPISQYNCYHYTFNIVLGVSEPEYTNEQLKDINKKANEKVEIDGKEYTRYELTQMQRKLETEVRKQKDIQIMAKASGQTDTVREAQQKITELTTKYKDISQKANIPTRMDRMKVSGYTRTKVNVSKEIEENKERILKNGEIFVSKEEQLQRVNFKKNYIEEQLNNKRETLKDISNENNNWAISHKEILKRDIKKYEEQLKNINTNNIKDKVIDINTRDGCIDLLKEVNINLQKEHLENINIDVIRENTKQYYETIKKYPFLEKSLQERDINLSFSHLNGGAIGATEISGRKIELNLTDYMDKKELMFWAQNQVNNGYNMGCSKENYINYFSTHELGHAFDFRVIQDMDIKELKDFSGREKYKKYNEYFMDNIYKIAEKNTGKTKEELSILISDYGKSSIDECMAELFANANCGQPNELGKAYDEYFKELLK